MRWDCRRDFNPRPPRGERHPYKDSSIHTYLFQSTPSARRATVDAFGFSCGHVISIHALREEGDYLTPCTECVSQYFNPRPPRGGRLLTYALIGSALMVFQSTPSARRATSVLPRCPRFRLYFNPRPPRGGRLRSQICYRPTLTISIHALREEGDSFFFTGCSPRFAFQSTPSARRATGRCIHLPGFLKISIHALREEGDSKSGEKIHHVCSIIHTCAQFEKELYEGSGEMQNKSC